jgi:hypothetical protein
MRFPVTVLVVAVFAVTPVVTGCGDDGPDEPRYPENILTEYRPRYDVLRAAVAAGTPSLPADPAPATAACTRPVEPAFDYIRYDAVENFEPGNTETVLAEWASDLAYPLDRTLTKYSVVPGFLARGLQITGDRGPLGSNEYAVGPGYARETDKTGAMDKTVLLRKVLDAGLRIRYLVVLRVTAFTQPVPITEPNEARFVGDVSVDASVLDLVTGDVPCRFRAAATASNAVQWAERFSTAEDRLFQDMQTSLDLTIDRQLTALTKR